MQDKEQPTREQEAEISFLEHKKFLPDHEDLDRAEYNYIEGFKAGAEFSALQSAEDKKEIESKMQNLEWANSLLTEENARLTKELQSIRDAEKSIVELLTNTKKELQEVKGKAEKVISLVPGLLQKLKEKGEPIELYAIIEALSDYRKEVGSE